MSPGDLRHLAIGPHADTVAVAAAASDAAVLRRAPVIEAAAREMDKARRFLDSPAIQEALRQRDVAVEALQRALPRGFA